MPHPEDNWLTEVMRLTGVCPGQEEEETGEWDPYIPGMLSFEEDDIRERERQGRLRLAEEQTLALIEDQEDLRESDRESGICGEKLHAMYIESDE